MLVHRDMTDTEYHSKPAYGSTDWKNFDSNPLYLKGGKRNKKDNQHTSAKAMGSFLHNALLNLELFGQNTHIAPEEICTQSGELSKKKDAKEYIESLPKGSEVITPANAHILYRCIDNLFANEYAYSLYSQAIEKEVSLFWDLEGVPVKCRPDLISRGGLLCDYKTTRHTDVRKTFSRAVRDFDYGLSEALYAIGCEEAGMAKGPMYFIVFSTTSFECQVMQLPRKYVTAQRDRLLRLIEDYKDRLARDEWTFSGYGELHQVHIGGFSDGDNQEGYYGGEL